MEKDLRASQDIETYENLYLHPICPIVHALHSSFLSSHCPSCFSPLRSCSSHCTSICASVAPEFPSSVLYLETDLRAAISLYLSLPPRTANSPRICSLLTNFLLLTCDAESENAERIRRGGWEMLRAVGLQDSDDLMEQHLLAACCLCLVKTNAVEVVDDQKRCIGIAVYGPEFSWINHSCSPNACYRFLISSPQSLKSSSLFPYVHPRTVSGFANDEQGGGSDDGFPELGIELRWCGPKIMVRSIKSIKKGEEITISYVDLLQPKEARKEELLSKYCFSCCCPRCSASPIEYIDRMLEVFLIARAGSDKSISVEEIYGNKFQGSYLIM